MLLHECYFLQQIICTFFSSVFNEYIHDYFVGFFPHRFIFYYVGKFCGNKVFTSSSLLIKNAVDF